MQRMKHIKCQLTPFHFCWNMLWLIAQALPMRESGDCSICQAIAIKGWRGLELRMWKVGSEKKILGFARGWAAKREATIYVRPAQPRGSEAHTKSKYKKCKIQIQNSKYKYNNTAAKRESTIYARPAQPRGFKAHTKYKYKNTKCKYKNTAAKRAATIYVTPYQTRVFKAHTK